MSFQLRTKLWYLLSQKYLWQHLSLYTCAYKNVYTYGTVLNFYTHCKQLESYITKEAKTIKPITLFTLGNYTRFAQGDNEIINEIVNGNVLKFKPQNILNSFS